MTALEAHQLACGYRRHEPVLRQVSLELAPGATLAVVGPSGGGKSTLLKTILGVVPPLDGSVTLLGHTSPARPPAGKVGYIPQGLGLVRNVSVLHNVLMGMLHETSSIRGLAGVFDHRHVKRAHDALEQLGLGHKAQARPIHLSGGERRRVAIARALAQRPEVLLADEILSELDHRTAGTVLDAIRTAQRETGMAILMVEHDLDTSCEIADVLCCLGGGTLRATLPRRPDRLEIAHRMAYERA